MVQGLPRVLSDVEAMRQEANLLREQMDMVKGDIRKIEEDTAHSMQRLVELDKIKSRMQESADALQEVDNWTALISDVDEVFASGDVDEMSARIQGMQQSLIVLHDVADFNHRKRKVESLKDKLEALVSPKLISAFNSHLLEDAKYYVEIFTQMKRQSQLQSYYNSCRKKTILQMWSDLCQSGNPLEQYLSTFFDELLTLWHKECMWSQEVFTSPLVLLSSLFTSSLMSLDPPMSKAIQSSIQHQGENALSILISLRQSSFRFLKGLKLSLQDKDASDLPTIYPIVEAVHYHYVPALHQYGNLEKQTLNLQLQLISFDADSLSDTVAAVSSSVNKVFSFCHMALERCVQLTEGWGLPVLQETTENFLAVFLQRVSELVKQQRKVLQLDSTDSQSEEGPVDEWSQFQSAFELIACCGEMVLNLSKLSSTLCQSVSSRAPVLRTPASRDIPFGPYNYLAKRDPQQLQSLYNMMASVEKDVETDLLPGARREVQELNQTAHQFAFDIIFTGLLRKLNQIPVMKEWTSEEIASPTSPVALVDDLPTFSLSPLPYITEIGDYLLTLPQQLEPFTSQDSPSLVAALQRGHLPYMDTEVQGRIRPSVSESEDADIEDHPSQVWISAVARGTMLNYSKNILKIPSFTEMSAHQLSTDIAYLCNVLAALGQNPTEDLKHLELLLKADKERFEELKKDSSFPSKLVKEVERQRWRA